MTRIAVTGQPDGGCPGGENEPIEADVTIAGLHD